MNLGVNFQTKRAAIKGGIQTCRQENQKDPKAIILKPY